MGTTMVKVTSRLGKNKVKVMSRQGQGNVKGDGQGKDKKSQGKDKVRSRQYKCNLNRNYNLMGFDIIEINLVLIIIPTLLESPAPNATVIRKIWPPMPMRERRILRLEQIFERQIFSEVLLVQLAGPT